MSGQGAIRDQAVVIAFRLGFVTLLFTMSILSTLDVEPGWHRLIATDQLVAHVRDDGMGR